MINPVIEYGEDYSDCIIAIYKEFFADMQAQEEWAATHQAEIEERYALVEAEEEEPYAPMEAEKKERYALIKAVEKFNAYAEAESKAEAEMLLYEAKDSSLA